MAEGHSSAVLDEPAAPAPGARDHARLRALVDEHLPSVWRALRRFGLPADAADDAAQRVFLVASRRLSEIHEGAERSFLLRTALRVACSARRSVARRREILDEASIERVDEAPAPDELIDQRRARVILDELLDELEIDLRAVFVLFEIEGMSVPEIAETLELATGTAASRLRRAREEFARALKRYSARTANPRRSANPDGARHLERKGGTP